MKEAVTTCEHQLMRVLGFELDVKHPQHYLLHIVREIEGTEELAAVSHYIANDSFLTKLCLKYNPATIACACIYLAGELISDQGAKESYGSGEWWDRFGATRIEIEDICHQLCDLYENVDMGTLNGSSNMTGSSSSSSNATINSGSIPGPSLEEKKAAHQSGLPTSASKKRKAPSSDSHLESFKLDSGAGSQAQSQQHQINAGFAVPTSLGIGPSAAKSQKTS